MTGAGGGLARYPGAGHGRFWIGAGVVVIAHRFGWALAYGSTSLAQAPLLAHRCDNPLCQRPHPDHVVVSTPRQNRLEWAIRRNNAGGPAADPRGSRRRAEAMRELIRRDPSALEADHRWVLGITGEQRRLF
jgi:hypothetical protein